MSTRFTRPPNFPAHPQPFTHAELRYAATARCDLCHAPMAVPLQCSEYITIPAWTCSAVLKGAANPLDRHGRWPMMPERIKFA